MKKQVAIVINLEADTEEELGDWVKGVEALYEALQILTPCETRVDYNYEVGRRIEVTPNRKPYIMHWDDIGDIHREIEGYEHCVRVNFVEPFTSEEEQTVFEEYAIQVAFSGHEPKDALFDWRDDVELWIRHN